MENETHPPGTYVITAGQLGTIVRTSRRGGAEGYDVQPYYPGPGDGWLPHFAEDWCIRPAVVGQTVCQHPRGTHWCGMVHVDSQVLAWLPRATS